MSDEPESLILKMLRDMRAEIGDMHATMATKADVAELGSELRSEMNSLRADVASNMIDLRKDVSEQIVGLRRSVVEYHTSVIGHGVIISELEARLRRVEQRLDVSGPQAY